MRVSVDVYTKDVDAALEALKLAIKGGATNVNLSSSEDYETGKIEHLNLMFEADHLSTAISYLDDGPFVKDTDDL